MSNALVMTLGTAMLGMGLTACQPNGSAVRGPEPLIDQAVENGPEATMQILKITIGRTVFEATLIENPTTAKLKELLPLALDMSELNGNEKFFHLASDLPAKASNPGTIRSGDLMLWGRNSLVLFYEPLETSYTYTPIGRINEPRGLADAVGKRNVTVTFELK